MSSNDRDSTFRGTPCWSYLLLNASPIIKLVANWLEVMALVIPVAKRLDRTVPRGDFTDRIRWLTTVGIALILSIAPIKMNTIKAIIIGSLSA